MVHSEGNKCHDINYKTKERKNARGPGINIYSVNI